MIRGALGFVALGTLAALAVGCQDDVATPFPDGLEPIEDNPLPADATHAELFAGATLDGDRIRVYGRGYVHAAPAVVWAVTKDPTVMIASCRTSSQTVTDNAEPGSETYERAYVVHYFVDDLVNVEWDDAWRYGTILGTPDALELGMIKHQKIQGSDFIAFSAGTIQVLATEDPNITELAFVEHLEAIQATTDDVLGSVQHTYESILARTHGDGNPPCP
ncbi:MAG: hypothetical protein H0T79_18375 [Deltaproteobacteria bacterium]|nr:hypothetical protein [Deltaproteobacteria bacterium]